MYYTLENFERLKDVTNKLDSPATSRVFFEVIKGNKTPKRISQALDIYPSAVVQHLNILRNIRIIKRTEKHGKEQPYKIDWKNFTQLVLSITTFEKDFKYKLPATLGRKAMEIINELSENEFFLFITQYFFREVVTKVYVENVSILKVIMVFPWIISEDIEEWEKSENKIIKKCASNLKKLRFIRKKIKHPIYTLLPRGKQKWFKKRKKYLT